MKIGVKFGLDNWNTVLSQTSPDCAEVWFRLDWKDKFIDIFKALRNKNIPYGIHFWAVVDGVYEPNLVFDQDGIADKTEVLMRETIDIASENGAFYVNIHPGSFILKKLILDQQRMIVLSDKKISYEQGVTSLLKRVKRLHEYAESKNILIIAETLPKNELAHWKDISGRKEIQLSENVGPEVLLRLGENGIALNNDFGHTVASWDDKTEKELWDLLYHATKTLAPYTRLIHLNTVRPPFNGTDSHNGVLEEDFRLGVVPNKEQLIDLLRLFKNREDVWIIPEPEAEKMVENYNAIQELVREL